MSYQFQSKIKNHTIHEGDAKDFKIRLDANESFLPPYDELRKVIDQAVTGVDLSRYPDPLAVEVSGYFGAYYGVPSENITATNGSSDAVALITLAFLRAGEKAMVLSNDRRIYRFLLDRSEISIDKFEKGDDLVVHVDDLIAALKKDQYRMIVFSNPCNPTSLGIKREDILQLVRSTDALVVIDESYMDFWDQSVIADAPEYDNLIIVRSASQLIGMAAIRLGFAVANKKLTEELRAVKLPCNINSMTQAAGSAVYSHPALIEAAQRKLLSSRNELYLHLNDISLSREIKVYPTCTNFLTVGLENTDEVFDGLKERSILVKYFPKYLRITSGTNRENLAFIEAMMQLTKKRNS